MIYRDKIRHIPITRDANYGNRTRGTAKIYRALVQDESGLMYGGNKNSNGKETEYDMLIFIPPDADVHKGDLIQVYKRLGILYDDTQEEVEVKKVSLVGGVHTHHKEVYI